MGFTSIMLFLNAVGFGERISPLSYTIEKIKAIRRRFLQRTCNIFPRDKTEGVEGFYIGSSWFEVLKGFTNCGW